MSFFFLFLTVINFYHFLFKNGIIVIISAGVKNNMKKAFDNDLYVSLQSQHIEERISKYDNKLYLEFGGKLFDDHHASRVLPGFEPDTKLQMLLSFKDKVEIIIAVNAKDIERKKMRNDLGIGYDEDVLRLIDEYRRVGLFVGSVTITQYENQSSISDFAKQLQQKGVQVFYHYPITGYPHDLDKIISCEGFGKNDYILTSKPLVVVTAPGPGSGKMATCLSQLYHEHLNGVNAGYAKFETFPIWNLPLTHPVNLAYEAATIDLNDLNMIDPYHLEAYQETTVNYNRDIEIFPVLKAMFTRIFGSSPYASPTDMGVNMAGHAIVNDEAARDASRREIVRRYYHAEVDFLMGRINQASLDKIHNLLSQADVNPHNRKCAQMANQYAKEHNMPMAAIELHNGNLVYGKTSPLLRCSSAALLNALKSLANIEDHVELISKEMIESILMLKNDYLNSQTPSLDIGEVLLTLSIASQTSAKAKLALSRLPDLKQCEMHSTIILNKNDRDTLRQLKVNLTCNPK